MLLRWFPDRETEPAIVRLRSQRAQIIARHAVVQGGHLRAATAEAKAKAQKRHVQAVAEAHVAYEAEMRASRARLVILARVSTLLRHCPALAYSGARRLIAMASRIERAREKGYDPGPRVSPP